MLLLQEAARSRSRTNIASLLETLGERRRYPAGHFLVKEGVRQQAIFILLGGTAQVQGNHLGSAVPISTLGPGEIFGDMSFLASAPASASVVALQAVEIQAIDHAALREAMAENPRLTADFYRLLACKLAARLRYVTEEVIALAQTTADTGQERRASDQSE